MQGNAVKPHEARALWEQVKTAAAQGAPSLLEGLACFALRTWEQSDAGTKLSEDRSTREAFVASLVGAAVVDATLDKLASEGAYTAPEVTFLRELNAEAALWDLARFQKNAGALQSALRWAKDNPAALGSVGGALTGGAFGAYSDDENRLRGALRFAVPGAAMGAMLGHGAGQLRNEIKTTQVSDAVKALEEQRAQELHAARLKLLKAQMDAAQRSSRPRF